MHPSRLTASHINNTTIHKEHIYDDPSLYKLAGHTRYQKDEIVMLEGDKKMIPGVVTQANHPNYQININGNNFTIDSTITSVFSALTPSTSVILNHQRYYQNATKPRLQVGDTAMYNEGNEYLKITTVFMAEHPNYGIQCSIDPTLKYYTTNERLFHPTHSDFSYIVANKQCIEELHTFGYLADDTRAKWLGTPTQKAIEQNIEAHIEDPDFIKQSPFFEKQNNALDDIVRPSITNGVLFDSFHTHKKMMAWVISHFLCQEGHEHVICVEDLG